MSFSHTPEQNLRAERTHRNITELGLTILFNNHCSKQFWVEAFSFGVWLINRLPTRVLDMKSPFERLWLCFYVWLLKGFWQSVFFIFMRLCQDKDWFAIITMHFFSEYCDRYKGIDATILTQAVFLHLVMWFLMKPFSFCKAMIIFSIYWYAYWKFQFWWMIFRG